MTSIKDYDLPKNLTKRFEKFGAGWRFKKSKPLFSKLEKNLVEDFEFISTVPTGEENLKSAVVEYFSQIGYRYLPGISDQLCLRFNGDKDSVRVQVVYRESKAQITTHRFKGRLFELN